MCHTYIHEKHIWNFKLNGQIITILYAIIRQMRYSNTPCQENGSYFLSQVEEDANDCFTLPVQNMEHISYWP